MENQNYADVMGTGTGSSNAPFLKTLLSSSSTVPDYHSYGSTAAINGCSAGCYEALTTGQQSHSDGWCPRASSPCFTISNIADQLNTAGLSSAMFCEDGCPRGADHFPWIAYTSTWNTCVTGSFTCTGQTGPDGNALYGSTSSNSGSFSSITSNAGNSAFINYLNSANPANYIWFTPSDNHNMHDNSITTGDNYLASLLVGTGTVSTPSAGTVFSTSLFKSPRTMLYLWWDEYDPSPNLEYGSMIKQGFVSSATDYDEYASLRTIENNWALAYLGLASQAPLMSDILSASTPPSFAITSTSGTVSVMQSFSQNVTLTAQSLLGFIGTVNLSASSNSSTVSVKLQSSTLTLTSGSDSNTTLTITSTDATPTGDYAITIFGSSGSISKSLTITLDVNILGDVFGNGIVNISDFSFVLMHYGTRSTGPNWSPLADLNHDGVVDVQDLSTVVANFNKSYSS